MTSYNCILTPKMKNRKRELIKSQAKYFNAGLITAKEMDRLISSILFGEVTNPRTRKLFVEDKL